MSDYQSLSVQQQEGVLTLTLDRPDSANGLNNQMGEELVEVARHCSVDPSIRAMVLTGSGKFFCAGGDVKSMHDLGDQVALGIKRLADNLHTAISMFTRMPAPVITAINGTAAGAGFSMAIFADIAIAAKSAKFTMAYAGVGLSPDGSSSYFLPRLVGLRKAQDLMLSNRVIGADEALEMGLLTQVVEDDELPEAAQSMAIKIASGSPQTNASIKSLLLSSFDNSLETQLELESRGIAYCAGTDNGREGINAFVNKRPAKFQ